MHVSRKSADKSKPIFLNVYSKYSNSKYTEASVGSYVIHKRTKTTAFNMNTSCGTECIEVDMCMFSRNDLMRNYTVGASRLFKEHATRRG